MPSWPNSTPLDPLHPSRAGQGRAGALPLDGDARRAGGRAGRLPAASRETALSVDHTPPTNVLGYSENLNNHENNTSDGKSFVVLHLPPESSLRRTPRAALCFAFLPSQLRKDGMGLSVAKVSSYDRGVRTFVRVAIQVQAADANKTREVK